MHVFEKTTQKLLDVLQLHTSHLLSTSWNRPIRSKHLTATITCNVPVFADSTHHTQPKRASSRQVYDIVERNIVPRDLQECQSSGSNSFL